MKVPMLATGGLWGGSGSDLFTKQYAKGVSSDPRVTRLGMARRANRFAREVALLADFERR